MGLGRLTDEVFEAVIFDLDGTLIDSTPGSDARVDDLGERVWPSRYGSAQAPWHSLGIGRTCCHAGGSARARHAAHHRTGTRRPPRRCGAARRGGGAGISGGRQECDCDIVHSATGRSADGRGAAGAAFGLGDGR